jgi:hypothetical protein
MNSKFWKMGSAPTSSSPEFQTVIMNPANIVAERLAVVKAFISGLGANQAVQEDVGFLSFVLTLLPIPGVQQAAQVTQRLADNQGLNLKLSEIWQAIARTNEAVRTIDDLSLKVETITNTVRFNSELQRKVEEAIAELKQNLAQDDSSWAVETSGCSTQQLMNVIVEASTVSVSADGNSKNFLDRVSVAAKHTKLTATNGSLNSISDSSFKGPAGEVRMQGEHTQRGNVTLQDSSVGFSGDSEVQFGGWRMGTRDGNFVIGTVQPAVPLLRCPICQAQFPRPANAIAFTGCQCPKCGARSMLPYQPR